MFKNPWDNPFKLPHRNPNGLEDIIPNRSKVLAYYPSLTDTDGVSTFLIDKLGVAPRSLPEQSGTIIYVSPNGSGTDGTTLGTPVSLTYAWTTKITNNSIVKLLPGTYTIGAQVTQKSGVTGARLTAYDRNNMPIIDGSAMTENRCLYLRDGYISFLEFRDVGRNKAYNKGCIAVDASASISSITDCKFIRCGKIIEGFGGTLNIWARNYIDRTYNYICASDGLLAGERGIISHNIIIGGPTCTVGTATGGTETELINTGTNFTTNGVFIGMIVRNISTGGVGLVTGIAATAVTFADGMSIGGWSSGNQYEFVGTSIQTSAFPINLVGDGGQVVTNNLFSGCPVGIIRFTSSMEGSAIVKNNILTCRAGYVATNSGASGSVSFANNLYLNGASGSFGTLFSGITDAGLSKTANWGLDTKIVPSSLANLFWRLDDAYYGSCGDCSERGYYFDLADILAEYGQSAYVAIDVAQIGYPGNYLTWDDVRELHQEYGFEFGSHSLSHLIFNNETNNHIFTVTSPAGGEISISLTGLPPSDSGTITITDGSNSIEIIIPELSNVSYSAKRGDGATPWDYTVINNGMPDPTSYDLGSIKGLRNYIASLSGWSCSVIDEGDWNYTQNTPSRVLSDGVYTSLSSEPILLSITRLHYWEFKYSKDVIEYQIGNDYECVAFTYPNFEFDATTIKSLVNYGYKIAFGYNSAGGAGMLPNIHMYNIGQFVLTSLTGADTFGDNSPGDEDDIRHAVRSIAFNAACARQITGILTHSFDDVSSLDQLRYIADEIDSLGYVNVLLPTDIVGMIRNSGDWNQIDPWGILWERRDFPEITFRVEHSSIAIGAGASSFIDGDGDQYDIDGYMVWSDDFDAPVYHWRDGVDIGPYAYGGTSKVLNNIEILSGESMNNYVIKFPICPTLASLDDGTIYASFVPNEIDLANVTDTDQFFAGTRAIEYYSTAQDEATIVRIQRFNR